MDSNQLDAVIAHLQDGNHLDEKCVLVLLEKLTEVLYEEPNLLRLHAPVTICGDIHGQLFDLFELFETGGDPATTQYLFMGDYVDRGYFSLETFMYLVALKLKYPQNIHLLRGNHECRRVSESYGFYNECLLNYGHAGIWHLCQDAFDLLPLCALIDGRVFATHGGLSPDVQLVDQVDSLQRQVELPVHGPLCDLAWSDPVEDSVSGWAVNQRGAGWLFGSTPANMFMNNNKLDLITRSHQIAEKGYYYWFGDTKILTVWSAPNYSYVTNNDASVLKLDAQHNRDIKIFKARAQDKRKKPVDYVPRYFT